MELGTKGGETWHGGGRRQGPRPGGADGALADEWGGIAAYATRLYMPKPNCGGLCQAVDGEAAAEFGFEPRGLGRHDIAGIGDADKLLHGDRIQGEGYLHLAGIHAAGQFSEAADTAYEVYALVGAEVLDSQDLVQNQVAEDGDIQYADG